MNKEVSRQIEADEFGRDDLCGGLGFSMLWTALVILALAVWRLL